MGRIVISENVSLDGVVEDPAGDEGFSAGGWVGLIATRPEVAKAALDEALAADVLLFGRRSYDWFGGRWPSRTGELADRLNSMPKYVVSSKLYEGAWNNTTVLRGDEVAALKDDLDGDVLVLASFGLLRTLMADDLVDEMRLKVFPIVLGSGARLFGESEDPKPLRLVETNALGDEIAFLRYQRQV